MHIGNRILFSLAIIIGMGVVTQSAAGAQASDEVLFVSASVDNDSPYLGEQITYSFRIYQRSDRPALSDRVEYRPPAFSGFWKRESTERREFSETVASSQYRVVELRTILFPSIVGTTTIEPATLAVLGASSETALSLKSEPVLLEVAAFPPGAPDDFAGAVGRFDISAMTEAATSSGSNTVNLRVEVSGEGNLESIPAPAWPDFADWRVIESPAEATTEIVDGRLIGQRVYARVLVPKGWGQLTIPEIGYAYFDPQTGQYERAMTTARIVTVSDSVGLPPISEARGDSATDGVGVSELRAIKDVPSSLRRQRFDLAGSEVYWALWSIPMVAIAGALAWRSRRMKMETARSESLGRRALSDAHRELQRAVSSGVDNRVASAQVISSYSSARFGSSVGLTRERLTSHLLNIGVSSTVVQGVETALEEGEAAQYTPIISSGENAASYVEKTIRLLESIEEAIES